MAKQHYGDRWQPHKASEWNAFQDAARAEHDRRGDVQTSVPVAFRPLATARVRNNDAAAVPYFAAVALRDPIIDDGDNEAEFLRVLNFEAYVAEASDVALSPQKLAIALQPLGADALGDVLLSGVAPCQVDIQADGDRWAGLTDGETYLTSSATPIAGGVEILWPTSGVTGTVWCYVRLPVDAVVPATVPGDVTHDGDVTLNQDVTIANNSNTFQINAQVVNFSSSINVVNISTIFAFACQSTLTAWLQISVKTGTGDTTPDSGDYPGSYYPAVPDESAKPGTIIAYQGGSSYELGVWIQVGGTACTTTDAVWRRLLTLEHLYKQDTSPPGINDDVTDGHYPGRLWLDPTNEQAYVCLDPTDAAAVWKLLTTALFTQLEDVPSSYSSSAGKFVAVNATEDGLEFVDAPGGGSAAGPGNPTGVPQSFATFGSDGQAVTVAFETRLFGAGSLTLNAASRQYTSDGVATRCTSPATTGTNAGWQGTCGVRRLNDPVYCAKFRLMTTTNVGFFCGLATHILTNMATEDIPISATCAGIHYRSGRDSNWQFIVQDVGNQTLSDSGVAVSNDILYCLVEMDDAAAEVTVTLLDSAYSVLASHTFTSSDDIPANTTTLVNAHCGLVTEANAAATVDVFRGSLAVGPYS